MSIDTETPAKEPDMSKVAPVNASDEAAAAAEPDAPKRVRKARVNGQAGQTKPVKTAKPAKGKAKAAKPAKAAKGKAKAKTRTLDPAKRDQFGFRLGSLKARAAAMYAAKKGATLNEVKEALDSTQYNLLTELEEKGFNITKTQIDGDGPRKQTRYKIVTK